MHRPCLPMPHGPPALIYIEFGYDGNASAYSAQRTRLASRTYHCAGGLLPPRGTVFAKIIPPPARALALVLASLGTEQFVCAESSRAVAHELSPYRSSTLSNGFDSPAYVPPLLPHISLLATNQTVPASHSHSTVFPAGSTSVSVSGSSSGSPSKLPTILAILFGVLIAIALLIGALWLVLRRVHDRRRARERAFRYGQSSVNPASSASAMGTGYYTSSAASAKSGGGLSGPGGGGSGGSSRGGLLHSLFSAFSSAPRHVHGHGHGHAPSMSVREQPGRTYTPVASLSSHVLEMGSMSLEMRERERELQRDREREREDAGTPNTARALLSASPTAWGGMRGKRSRGDADSLRTDFLQV